VTSHEHATMIRDASASQGADPNGADATRIARVDSMVACRTVETRHIADELTTAASVAGDVREVSVVMADLRGFTAFCEGVPPSRMSRVLNQYLGAMVDVILGQHGRVQDFVGDGILGVFGAPLLDADHAWHAALTALQMQLAMRALEERWLREEGLRFGLGVAVHSGQAFAGSVGCPKQRKYAVVGDPVNTAARLEELNRVLNTRIVISGDALARVRDRVDVNRKGSFTVRGRTHPIEVFELLGVCEPREHPVRPLAAKRPRRSSTSARALGNRREPPALPLPGDHRQVERGTSTEREGESR
jgi:class 3 adenylate cyclase